MKTIALSIEQMNHLKELGVDISGASMFWEKQKVDWMGNDINNEPYLIFKRRSRVIQNFESYEVTPAFTLQDILEMLPKRISVVDEEYDDVYHIYILMSDCKGRVSYDTINYNYHNTYLIDFDGDNILDASYEMLCWVAENGYLKQV